MNKRIMILEDDAVIALHLSTALKEMGYSLAGMAGSHKAGLAIAAREQPDLILVDIGLREPQEGIAAATDFHHKLGIPVVYLTAYTDPETIARAGQAEPFGYVAKPFEPNSLRATIEMALQRSQMERALKASEERFRYLFEHLAQGVIYQDADGTIQMANPAAEEILGLSLEEMRAQSLTDPQFDLCAADGTPLRGEEYAPLRALRSGQDIHNQVAGLIHPRRKERRWIRLSAAVQSQPGEDKAYQVITTVEDVTSLHQAEKALQRSAAEFRSLVEHLPDIVSRFDRNLRYCYVSPAIEPLTGLRPEELLGKTNREAGMPPELVTLWDEITQGVFQNGVEASYRYPFRGQSRDHWFESRLVPEFDERGQVEYVLVVDRDVTALHLAEQALQETERKLRTLFDNLIGMAYRCANDPDFSMEFCSQGCLELTGYPPEELLGNKGISFSDLIVLEDRQRVHAEVDQALSQGQRFHLHYRILNAREDVRWVEELGQGIYSAGRLEALEGFIMDVTERVQAGQALAQAEKTLSQTLDGMPIAVGISDQEGRILYINHSFVDLLGYRLEDIPDSAMLDRLAFPEDSYRQNVVSERPNILNTLLLNGEMIGTGEYRIICKDRSEKIVQIHAALISGNVVTLFQDMTSLRAAELELRRNEDFMRQLLEDSPVAAVIATLDRRIEFANRQFTRLFGYTQSELLNLDELSALVQPDEAAGTALQRWQAGIAAGQQLDGIMSSLEWHFLTKTQETKNVRLGGKLVHERLFLTFEDITSFRESERRMAASLAEKETLLREVHHRVKNNLQVMASLLGLQAAIIQEPKLQTLLNESQNRIHSMAMIHENLYQSQNLANVNFGNYLHDLVSGLAVDVPIPPGVQYSLEIEEVFLPVDIAIPCGLIVNELVTNAFLHAFPQGRRGEVTVCLSETATGLCLEVTDDGTGLPAGLELEGAASLGLTLVRILSHQLRGELTCSAGPGASFHLLIPRGLE